MSAQTLPRPTADDHDDLRPLAERGAPAPAPAAGGTLPRPSEASTDDWPEDVHLPEDGEDEAC